MGSSCSILNDTEYEVWVTDRINWPVLIGVSAGVAALLLSAGGIAAFLVLGSVKLELEARLAAEQQQSPQSIEIFSELLQMLFDRL